MPGAWSSRGRCRAIFNAPAHPYTKALLNSIPRMSDNRRAPDRDRRASRPICRRCRPAAPSRRAARRRSTGCRDRGAARVRRSATAGPARCWLAAPARCRQRRQPQSPSGSSVMTAVLEAAASPSTSRSRRGMFGGDRRRGARRGRHLVRDRARPDAGRRRRVGLRQDDHRQARARAGGADRRHHPVRGPRPAGAGRGRPPRTTASRCRRCSRTRTPRSTRACASAPSSPSR